MKQLKNQRGETIVEVVAAFMLLMIFMAVFAASLRFARAMTVKTETLREAAYNRVAQLYPLNNEKDESNNEKVKWEAVEGTQSFSFSLKGQDAPVIFTVSDVTVEVNKKQEPQQGESQNVADAEFYRYKKQTTAGENQP